MRRHGDHFIRGGIFATSDVILMAMFSINHDNIAPDSTGIMNAIDYRARYGSVSCHDKCFFHGVRREIILFARRPQIKRRPA